jgi:hypothetical protein
MRRILLAMAVAALMAVMAASSAAAQGEPVGSCPPDFNLFTVAEVLEHVDPDTPGQQSWDGNGDGYTCVKFIAGADPVTGGKVVIVDNRLPL